MILAEQTYSVTRLFPHSERFGLALQLRRAAVSIPSNIAEGQARGTSRAYVHHLRIALGSEAELKTQLELASRLKLVSPSQAQPALAAATEVGKMLNGLIKSLTRDP